MSSCGHGGEGLTRLLLNPSPSSLAGHGHRGCNSSHLCSSMWQGWKGGRREEQEEQEGSVEGRNGRQTGRAQEGKDKR